MFIDKCTNLNFPNFYIHIHNSSRQFISKDNCHFTKPPKMPSQTDSTLVAQCIDNITAVCTGLDFAWGSEEGVSDYLYRIIKDYHATAVHLTNALVYLDRIYRDSPTLLPDLRALLTISLVLSLKFWEDKVHSNKHYAHCAGFSLQQLNSWERAVLTLFDYNFSVSKAEYEMYWVNLTGVPVTKEHFEIDADAASEHEERRLSICIDFEAPPSLPLVPPLVPAFVPTLLDPTDPDFGFDLVNTAFTYKFYQPKQPTPSTEPPMSAVQVQTVHAAQTPPANTKVVAEYLSADAEEQEPNCLKTLLRALSLLSTFFLLPTDNLPKSKASAPNKKTLSFSGLRLNRVLCV